MQIHAVSCIYGNNRDRNKPYFKSLIKDSSALPVIEKLSKFDAAELKKIERRLSSTKFWDLKISSIGNKFEEFKYSFIHKTERNNVISDGIYPYSRQGNTIRFYSIVYGPENTAFNAVDTLRFKSDKKAKTLFEQYQQNIQLLVNRNYNISPIESLKMKEHELKMLEESSKTIDKDFDAKSLVNTEIVTKKTIGNKMHK